MDLYQVFITHNRPWTVRELICYLTVFAIAAIYTWKLFMKKRILQSQAIAVILLLIFLGWLFGSTVFTRMPDTRVYRLELFWSWKAVLNGNRELLVENLLNCVLLFPMGLLFPAILNRNIRWWKGFLIGALVSAVIETCQLAFCRGLFEWDDMIHNGIGCMAGCVIMSKKRK